MCVEGYPPRSYRYVPWQDGTEKSPAPCSLVSPHQKGKLNKGGGVGLVEEDGAG